MNMFYFYNFGIFLIIYVIYYKDKLIFVFFDKYNNYSFIKLDKFFFFLIKKIIFYINFFINSFFVYIEE